jgi:hypothetical protein
MQTNAMRLYLSYALIAVFELAISYYMQAHIHQNGDTAIHVNTAWRILHGATLYKDIINIGLPMQFYIRIPQMMLADKLGANIFFTGIIFDNMFGLVTLILSLSVLYRLQFRVSQAWKGFVLLALIYIIFIFAVSTRTIGEKEYYIWLFTFPYFCLAAARFEGVNFSIPLRLLIGIYAAFGFAYKPVTCIPLLLVEGYLCVKNRSLRSLLKAELVICALLDLAYLLWMFTCLPDYRGIMLPLAQFYYAMRPEILDLLNRLWQFVLLQFVLLTLFCVYLQYAKPRFHRFMRIWCIAIYGFMLGCVIQMKSFYHHYYPINATLFLLFIIAAIAQNNRLKPQTSDPSFPRKLNHVSLLHGLFLLLLIEYFCFLGIEIQSYDVGYGILTYAMQSFKRENGKPAESVYELSNHIGPMFYEGMYRGLPWDYHFNHMWLLDGILLFKDRSSADCPACIERQTYKAETYLKNTVTDDVVRLKPDIIIAEPLDGIDVIKYFSQNPAFAEAFKNYTLQGKLWDYKRQWFFTVYFRSQPDLPVNNTK